MQHYQQQQQQQQQQYEQQQRLQQQQQQQQSGGAHTADTHPTRRVQTPTHHAIVNTQGCPRPRR